VRPDGRQPRSAEKLLELPVVIARVDGSAYRRSQGGACGRPFGPLSRSAGKSWRAAGISAPSSGPHSSGSTGACPGSGTTGSRVDDGDFRKGQGPIPDTFYGRLKGTGGAKRAQPQALEADIRAWNRHWNENPRPFALTKTAEEILNSLAGYL